MLRTRKTLTAFGDYLDKNSIMLKTVRIEQIDAFLAAHNRNYVKGTSDMPFDTAWFFSMAAPEPDIEKKFCPADYRSACFCAEHTAEVFKIG